VCFVYYTLTGNVVIAAMTQEDCVDATKLIMALFFKVRPQDFLAKERLQKEQSERVYEGLVNGATEAKDRLLIAAKVGGKVVGVAEVSLPGGQRFGAEKLEPKAPGDFPYISDVAVAPNQGKRGIGRALVRACEAAVAAQVSLY
jgi:ribosomal protein S18 acetylase RimI-like enzyme|tara:strand:+ start:344 stop:775 length:432 start_codon:yes stop_codon:yes gene_type:complete